VPLSIKVFGKNSDCNYRRWKEIVIFVLKLYSFTMRLDVYLVEKKICSAREKAKDLIQKGGIRVNGVFVNKSSVQVGETDLIEFPEGDLLPYVSKGGLKLEKAIKSFSLDLEGKKVLDIGASTGGFTDCALQHGAEFVWAVDVGNNQLDQRLRSNTKICSLENTDFRLLKMEDIGGQVDVIVGDISFISLLLVLKYIPSFLIQDGFVVLLIKPQFEVGPDNIGKGGIVTSPQAHAKAISRIVEFASSISLGIQNITFAPIVNPKKNIEYLSLFKMAPSKQIDIKKIVTYAFLEKRELFDTK
jgi:23S rRNA (cytidine1920-2'-O)/16S rRNA (cytidine1409-2'-O)-methyltransferase